MAKRIIALADCNSFFASCELVFNPSLAGKPVVVLSSNDACVIARNQEAKRLGIKMQAMGHEVKRLVQSDGLTIFSTNPELYKDMSRRVMLTLQSFCPVTEKYSIDESFLDLTTVCFAGDLSEYAQKIRSTVKQWTGIPVSIGLASTKTLAKVANHIAKADLSLEGVSNLTEITDWRPILEKVPVREVWGIGRRLSESLQAKGIYTAWELSQMDENRVLNQYSVVLQRTVLELRGRYCLPVEESKDKRKGLTVSRCFGQAVTELDQIKAAIATFTTRLAEKLRAEEVLAKVVVVSMRTNRYAKDKPQYEAAREVYLSAPTNQTNVLIKELLKVVEELFKPGYEYYKAGVYAVDLCDVDAVQVNLFEQATDDSGSKLMRVMDAINVKYGRDTLKFGVVEQDPAWKSRCAYPSKQYTTNWKHLPTVRA